MKPILFKGEMVRAILDGRKTMTRRVIKPKPTHRVIDVGDAWYDADGIMAGAALRCPYGQPGDRLWVRETWQDGSDTNGRRCVVFKADGNGIAALCCEDGNGDPVGLGLSVTPMEPSRWRPSIHMPRWASRITLEIVSVRVERLCQITEQDALAEGVSDSLDYCDPETPSARMQFKDLWDSINAKRGFVWDSNPYVWALEFKKL